MKGTHKFCLLLSLLVTACSVAPEKPPESATMSPISSAPSAAQAEAAPVIESSKRKDIEELLILTNTDAMMDGISSQMSQMMHGTAQQLGIDEPSSEIFDRYMVAMTAIGNELGKNERADCRGLPEALHTSGNQRHDRFL